MLPDEVARFCLPAAVDARGDTAPPAGWVPAGRECAQCPPGSRANWALWRPVHLQGGEIGVGGCHRFGSLALGG